LSHFQAKNRRQQENFGNSHFLQDARKMAPVTLLSHGSDNAKIRVTSLILLDQNVLCL